ncbi:MAG: type II toxin-antitoxin system VapC family toxin [Planctomycetes bacterium]|nr:type II toxin-antitoxin system VapC family toxin [Planctomycetota bacterium]
MSIIIDTQALLWFLLDDPRLSEKARIRIETESDQVFVSPASLWEVAIKVSLGKYYLPIAFEEFWQSQLFINSFAILQISIDHTGKVAILPFHHRDPFDRLIIAQALVEDFPVVSIDEMFDKYDVSRIW